MGGTEGPVWKCPICGSKHSNDWMLSVHIAGMALTYAERHRDWAEQRVPDFNPSGSRSPSPAASVLRPWVLREVRPHRPHLPPQLLAQNLLPNLTEAYKLIALIEIGLHDRIINKLREAYGEGEEEWWDRGVHQKVREDCFGKRNQEAPTQYKLWHYMDIKHLKVIIDKQWELFKGDAERIDRFPGKPQFLKQFEELNRLRNVIMHPLKGTPLGEDDFQFLRRFSKIVEQFASE